MAKQFPFFLVFPICRTKQIFAPFSRLDLFRSFAQPQFCQTALRGHRERMRTSAFTSVHYPNRSCPWPFVPAVFLTQERRRSLETNSVAEKRIRAGMADGPRASRPNFHCILETAGYYEREMFLPPFLVPSLPPSSLYVLVLFPASLARFSICFLTDTNGSLE